MFLLETIISSGYSSSVNAATNANTNAPLAAGAMRLGSDATTYLQHINWSSPTWDLFIVLFFIVTVFLYGISMGRERVIVILVNIYMALAVVTNAPYINTLDRTANSGNFFAFKALTFLATFVLLFLLMSRSALAKTFGGIAGAKWWQVILFSTFHVGLLVSIILSFLPAETVSHLAPMTRQLLASDNARFFWIVAPILALAFVKSEEFSSKR
jgi:hypothetical protein